MSSENSTGSHVQRSTKTRLIVSALLLLLLALGFNALLSLNSLEKLYVESIASQYSAIGKDLQRNIESALRFGKNIEKFVGIEKLLEATRANLMKDYVEDSTLSENVQSPTMNEITVSIALTDGTLLYSTDDVRIGTQLPDTVHQDYADVQADLQTSGTSKIPSYVQHDHTYYTPLPILDRQGNWVATAIITFDEQQVKALLDRVRNHSIQIILGILAGSMLLLLILLNTVPIFDATQQRLSKWRIALIMLMVIGVAQVLFSVLNTRAFGEYYLQINQNKAKTLTALLKEDIEFLLSKGIQIDKLVKMDELMGEIIDASPEVSGIKIVDKDRLPLYTATDQGITDFQKATNEEFREAYLQLPRTLPRYTVLLELLKDEDVQGFVSTHLSWRKIWGRRMEIALDSATILVISMLFFGELLILSMLYLERRLSTTSSPIEVSYEAIRPAGFLLLFGSAVSISFLPLYVETLYEPLLGLSKDMVMGLPISVKMFFTGLAISLAGFWIDRRGWREPFLVGVGLTGGGVLYSWLAPDIFHFIISRGLTGFGYGFALMAAQGFVITHTDKSNKTHGLAHFFAGVYAGSICGGAAGGMLAERIGYSPIFLIGAIIIFSVLVYAVVFMRSDSRTKMSPKPEPSKDSTSTANAEQGLFRRFLLNRNIVGLILLSSFPAAIATIGFLNYYSPIYLKRIGVSQSNIGRIFMLHGLCLVYLAPFISKYIDASTQKKRFIVIGGILGSVALILFPYIGGMFAAATTVLILGISASLVDSRNSYILKLPVSQKLGTGKAMGLFSSATRIGQVLGPIIFGMLIVQGEQGVSYAGGIYLLATILLMLVISSDKKIHSSRIVE